MQIVTIPDLDFGYTELTVGFQIVKIASVQMIETENKTHVSNQVSKTGYNRLLIT